MFAENVLSQPNYDQWKKDRTPIDQATFLKSKPMTPYSPHFSGRVHLSPIMTREETLL
jgi:hypothetical protein